MLFTTLLSVFAIAHSALAGVYITNPVGSTKQQGGQVITVTWADDGNTPTVGSIGPCTIDIYTGSKTVQTQLQNLAASVDVSKASSVSATVDPSIGPNGSFYFIRVTSLNLKDTANPQYPYQAFSAKFELQGMSGNFSQAVLAQIQDSGVSPSSVTSASKAATSSTSSTATKVAGAASAATSSSAASPKQVASGGLLALLVGVAGYVAL